MWGQPACKPWLDWLEKRISLDNTRINFNSELKNNVTNNHRMICKSTFISTRIYLLWLQFLHFPERNLNLFSTAQPVVTWHLPAHGTSRRCLMPKEWQLPEYLKVSWALVTDHRAQVLMTKDQADSLRWAILFALGIKNLWFPFLQVLTLNECSSPRVFMKWVEEEWWLMSMLNSQTSCLFFL